MIDNANQILLPPSLFINAIIEFSSSSELQEHLKFPNLLSPDIAKKLSNPSSQWTRIDGLVQDDGEHLVVPEDVSLRTDIICSAHSPPHASHPGIEKTCEILSRNYYWNTLRRNVTEFVKTCSSCQQTKLYPSKPMGLLQPIPPPPGPWQEITTDLIIELPLSNEFNAILVIVNRFTKHAYFIPTYTELSAE